MKTRSGRRGEGSNVGISTSRKAGSGEKDAAPRRRETHSPILKSKVSLSTRNMNIPEERTASSTPSTRGKKMAGDCNRSSSPVIGSRRFLGTGSLPSIFGSQKKASSNNEGIKKKQDVSPEGPSVALPQALCERNNVARVKRGNRSKRLGTKRKTEDEKENFYTPRLPAKKSRQTRNDAKSLQHAGAEEVRGQPRAVLSAVETPEPKQTPPKTLKRASKRIKNKLNSSADRRGMQRAEVREEENKSPRNVVASTEERMPKKNVDGKRSDRRASSKEATEKKTQNRKLDQKNSSPQTKGIRDQQKSCNEKRRSSPRASVKTPRLTVDSRASRRSRDTAASSKTKQNKPNLPIWSSMKTASRTPGSRKSFRIVSRDVYEFQCNSGEEERKGRRAVRRRDPRGRKKPRPQTVKTLLTTDPNWEDPLFALNPMTTVSSSLREGQQSISNLNSSLREGQESISSLNSSLTEDLDSVGSSSVASSNGEIPDCSITSEYNADDGFDTHDSQEDDFEGFEFETLSSFVSRQDSLEPTPMISSSVSNTPAIPSFISKFLGGSSTPRVETTLPFTSEEPRPQKTVQDDIATCFGFDDSVASAGDGELSLSPVRSSELQSSLELTGASDVSGRRACPEVSRFSWCSLRPGRRSYVSAMCTSSMLAHGRTLPSSSSSAAVQSETSTCKRAEVGKSALKRKNDKESHPEGERIKRTSSKSVAPRRRECEDANTSALFDEEEEVTEGRVESEEEEEVTEGRVESEEEEEATEGRVELEDEDQSTSWKNHSSKGRASRQPKTFEYPALEESFSEPPKKTYKCVPRGTSRPKRNRKCKGNITPGSDIEDDTQKEKPRRKKKASKKDPKKRRKDDKLSQSSSMSSSRASNGETCTSAKDSALEKSLKDWASDLNSHFSEIDDHELSVI